jgi:hypothetical protein
VFEVKVVHLNEMRTLNAQEKSGTVKTKSLTPSDLFMKQFVLTPLLARQLEGYIFIMNYALRFKNANLGCLGGSTFLPNLVNL